MSINDELKASNASVEAVSNAKAYWVYQDPDGVKWPTYDLYTQWCRDSRRRSKFAAIDEFCIREGIYSPPDVVEINNARGWKGHEHERRDEERSKPRGGTQVHDGAFEVKAQPDRLDTILDERKRQHGDFTDHARIAVALKTVFDQEVLASIRRGQPDLTATQIEAAHMILHKLARVVAGDPNHKDHWDDIAGYARIASDRI